MGGQVILCLHPTPRAYTPRLEGGPELERCGAFLEKWYRWYRSNLRSNLTATVWAPVYHNRYKMVWDHSNGMAGRLQMQPK